MTSCLSSIFGSHHLCVCTQLDELCARLHDPHSKFGTSDKPEPVSISSSFTGYIQSVGDISLHSTPRTAQGSRLKMEWIRRSAPMPSLRTAIEALLEAFWAQAPQTYGLPPTCNLGRIWPAVRAPCTPGQPCVSAQNFTGPAELAFMEVLDTESQPTPKWSYIPEDLQEVVHQWFQLFCFELHELGYHVWQTPVWHTNGVFHSYRIQVAN